MQKTRAKTIKGLSIANIILSGLYIVCFLIGIIVFSALVEYAEPIMDSIVSSSMSESYDPWTYSLHHNIPDYNSYDSSIYDYEYGVELLALTFKSLAFLMAAGLVMQAVSLAGAIIMLINSDKPQKLGMVFGWGIAGAIIAFLSGGVVQTVLFVLGTIFAYKDRQLYQNGQYPIQVVAQASYNVNVGQAGSVPVASVPVYTNPPVGVQTSPEPPASQPVVGTAQAAGVPVQPMSPESQQTIQVADEMLAPSEVDVVDVETVIQPGDENNQAGVSGNNQ